MASQGLQRPRRPTAWQVSFPGESSEDEHEDEGVDRVELEPRSQQEELAVLNGKRKTCSIVDERPAKRHSREPSLHYREGGDEKRDGDSDGPLYYSPRPDELPESAPDIAFLLGESDVPLSPTTSTDEDKPVRLLHDWAVFDARPSKSKDADGALALALISLHALDDTLDSTDVDCAPEGAGAVSPYCENEEDAGQEDDGGYDDDDNGGDEEGVTTVSVRLRLGAILRYTIDYSKRDDPIYLETTLGWYILGAPAPEYRALFAPFFRAHKIAQALVCTLMRDPHTPLDAFIVELQLTDCMIMNDLLGDSSYLPEMREVQNAIPTILEALDTLDDSTARDLRSAPLLRRILATTADSGSRGVTASHRLRPRHHSRTNPRRAPFRLPATIGNPDIAVLRPENQHPTHVTPRIAALAAGLFREQLVVLGRQLPAARLRRGSSSSVSKGERDALVRALAMALCAEGTQSIEAPVDWRVHPRRPFMHRVALCDVRGLLPKILFEVGDVVLVPIGEDDAKRGHTPASLPGIPEAAPLYARLADYFWFGRIIHINAEDERVHVQWFDHVSNTFLDNIADPRELFLTPLCDTLSLITLCGTVPVVDMSGATTVRDDFDGYYVRFLYDKKDASFVDLPPPIDPHAVSDPPHNCTICAQREEEEMQAQGRIIRRMGAVTGVAINGRTFHVGDFVLLRAEQGPARIVQITGLFSGNPVWVKVQLLGRVSDLVDLPADELRDERHLFLTDETEEVPLDDVLGPCYVLHHGLIFDRNLWIALGAEYFYYRYRLTGLPPGSWKELETVKESAGVGCETCAYALQARLAEAVEFAEEAQKHKLRAFDVFAGAGAMSLGMEGATGGMRTTHAVEISPSAARTFRRNAPKTIVYNQCVNELLRYAVKSHRGILEEDEVPKDIYDNSRLPPPPQPGDIEVITAGFPCQPHSQLNMFQKANDVKSNLILNLLSWVDFLQPQYCIFENVRGFLSYNLNAIQVDEHRTAGGISMGGLKFLVHAMLAMNYQVRFCLLQAAHYGTPQTRVRFFLFGARRGHPLLAAPQPTHDFPQTHKLEVRFPNGDIARTVRAEAGTAPFKFVTIDDAISDLPRFDWRNPNLGRLPSQKRNEARQREVRIPVLECDQEKPHVGFSGSVQYHHAPRTTFQAWCRSKGRTEDLQHFTRTLKPATVERVVNIPLTARADYRSLEKEHWQWQFSDPASAIARKGFRPGLYGRLDKDYVFQTTVTNVEPTAKQSRVLNPYCHRMITVRELARSQGFPDSFVFYSINDNVVTMHRQIGNAVPWPVAAAIGRELREARLKKWRRDRQEAMAVD